MSKSIEHSHKFHMVRRLVRAVAPDFRLLARKELGREQSCLDVHEKTIEVSESATEMEMVGAALFQLGHARLLGIQKYKEHFGEIKDQDEKALIKKLITQGIEADTLAATWSLGVFLDNFNVDNDRAIAIIMSHKWTADDWNDYYNG
jgi:hypothetical protein